ncbi:MAG: hypothetical protein R3F61_20505 [Myxococcota bacterium]
MVWMSLLACAPEIPGVDGDPAEQPAEASVLVDLTDVDRWESFDGVDGTGCSFGPAGWSIRQESAGTGYCWLGLRDPVAPAGGTLSLTAAWTGTRAAHGRVQAELEGADGDDYADWPVSPGSADGTLLTDLEGPVQVALRLAVGCEDPCTRPVGVRVDRLELWAR